jgi:hypothetical protein
MPLVACGYLIEQEYMTRLFMAEADQEMHPVYLVSLVTVWQTELTPEQKAGVPPIKRWFSLFAPTVMLNFYLYASPVLVRDVNVGYASGVFLVLTRVVNVETEADCDEKLAELESDKMKKRKFAEVFGRGLEEGGMVFYMTPWKLYR